MQTYDDFAKIHGLTLGVVFNGLKAAPKHWGNDRHNVHHWTLTLNHPSGESYSFKYYTGEMVSKVDMASVLGSLALDASARNNSGFEDWARDLGYNEDSRSAERMYEACMECADALEKLLGSEGLEELLYHTSEDGQ